MADDETSVGERMEGGREQGVLLDDGEAEPERSHRQMETFHYAHLPNNLAHVHVALFNNVSNAALIRQRIVRASQLEGPEGDQEREAVNFAFIDARLVRSSTP